jgi:hypothetical protein
MDAVAEKLYPSHLFRHSPSGCSSVDRVLASEAKGRGFDPRQPHQPSIIELAPSDLSRSGVACSRLFAVTIVAFAHNFVIQPVLPVFELICEHRCMYYLAIELFC